MIKVCNHSVYLQSQMIVNNLCICVSTHIERITVTVVYVAVIMHVYYIIFVIWSSETSGVDRGGGGRGGWSSSIANEPPTHLATSLIKIWNQCIMCMGISQFGKDRQHRSHVKSKLWNQCQIWHSKHII